MQNKPFLQRCPPETQGISSRSVLKFVEAVEQQIHELHSFMLLRHGQVAAEGWWSPYAPQRPHMLFSLSKSFTSTAVGLAAAEGHLSIDDPVLSFFPEARPTKVSAHLEAMRIRHLLSMSSGHAKDTTGRITARKDGDWVKGFLALPVKHRPGTHFVYNSGATYMLSAILQKVTGISLLDYLRPRLFEPLGVENPTWETCPRGVNTGGWGLSIRTEDIARFGQMYLQKGSWNGQQIVPEEWVAAATSYQVSNSDGASPDWKQGYGYQFWRCQHGAYRGDGAFGQYCVVMPEQAAVLAITGGVNDMQAVLDLVWEHLLPAMQPAALPADSAAQAELNARLAGLALKPPAGEAVLPIARPVSGKIYRFKANPLKLKSLAFDFQDDCVVKLENAHGKYQLACGFGFWRENSIPIFGATPNIGVLWGAGAFPKIGMRSATPQPVAASCIWTAEDTLQITLRRVETPFYHTLTCRFIENRLQVSTAINVSFGPTEVPTFEGK